MQMQPFLVLFMVVLMMSRMELKVVDALSSDGEALLGLLASTQISDTILRSWNPKEDNPCSWEGISCSEEKRVTARFFHQTLGT